MKGTENYTKVIRPVKPGDGGAHHLYKVVDSKAGTNIYASVLFQEGLIPEAGVNGCHNEDLIAIVIDRLESFQAGDYACPENQKAINKLMEAMFWLNVRTADRQKRGVEGTSDL